MNLGGKTAIAQYGRHDGRGHGDGDYIATVIMRIPSQKAGGNVQIVGGDRSIVKVALDPSSSPG